MAQDGIGPVQQQDSTASNNMMLNTMPTAIVNDPFDWAGPNFEFADLSEASSTQPFTTSLAGQIFGAPQATDVMPLTLTLVGQHVDVTCRNFGPFRVKPCWENWIYEESRRRLAVLYRTLNVLIYFEPAEMCTLQSDLVMAPLPARKRLWEAGNPLAWKEEMAKDQGVQSEYGLTANGDLVRMYASQDYCNGESRLMYETIDERSMAPSSSHKSSDVWEDWCSGMDEFGGLVMLAAVVLT
ncbi:hypothetical protein CMQ_702 [Grosmannia clavigera kw1407]|uniref:Uncharacterized protein n=1 Tax=Grosmannia clavigera (strain kw1407 / UAMH 11150) TaxID=655863 RepID=F0XCR7_GROCL|nr:uncharacterized protein CMQ_702 [Grosmannia clavigera kw1407]EFX03774.1 hypothetical protein CMQ_702 [Grosmannia clavigera kw1407]